jgi:hypothetical protein
VRRFITAGDTLVTRRVDNGVFYSAGTAILAVFRLYFHLLTARPIPVDWHSEKKTHQIELLQNFQMPWYEDGWSTESQWSTFTDKLRLWNN